MPKTKIDYTKTTFYRIVCNDVNISECYVGHTTNFIKRKQQHKSVCNKEGNEHYNTYKYTFIRDNGGWCNWSMVLIKEQECNDINDAKRQERLYIEEYQAKLNKCIPTRTRKEYDKQYKKTEVVKEQAKKYREVNKNKIKEQRETNKEYNKEYNKKYREVNKNKIKEYEQSEKRKKYINKYNKEYYKKKKEQTTEIII
jgi:hypothetical protein